MAIAYIKVFFDFDERTEALSDPEKERLLLAMVRYAARGDEPILKGSERILWPVFRKEIDHQMAVYNTRIENGNKGGRPNETENNRTKPNETENNRTETENNRNPQEQEQDKEFEKEYDEEQKQDHTLSLDQLFNRFWKAYPRKDDKKAARKEWNRIRPGPDMFNDMMEALKKQKNSDQWTKEGGKFIPLPSTWLHGERWQDEGTNVPAQIRPVVDAQDYDQPGKTLRLRGKGLPVVQGYGSGKGDLVVNISVYIPKTLSREEKEMIKKFTDSDNFKGDKQTKDTIFQRFKNYFN